MTWNAGSNFHQDHEQSDSHSHYSDEPFAWPGTHPVVGRTSGQPSHGGSHRANLGNGHENGIAQKHASGRGQSNTEHGKRRCLIACVYMAETLVHPTAAPY